ncbi:hypothetical protein ACRXCV_04970 [Halobacteriovorax sp. GFR7]|uniref:hypothetical protein n=1 Tax=unclassified Halobacteriovorax TaxID=2639665 RepID=UPI003D99683D
MKNLMIILTILLTSSTWARSFSECLDTKCLRERATNFKAFLKAEEEFTNELGKAFPNSTLDKLVTIFVDEIRIDFNNANIDRETTLSQMKNNIREKGVHAAFVNPAIVFMDMYASLGKKDKVLSMANIINTLNPAIGDTLEKDFGIEIDRNYEPSIDAPKQRSKLPSNFKPSTVNHGDNPFGGPRMAELNNQFNDKNEEAKNREKTFANNGLKPRMGDSKPRVNEEEMISPILANKLEQDKNSLLYSMNSGVDTRRTKLCFGVCGVVTGLGTLGSILSGGALLPAVIKGGLSCSIGCLGVAYSEMESAKKKNEKSHEPGRPRTSIGAPEVPESKPDIPKVDLGPKSGDGEKPDEDGDKPKDVDKPKKKEGPKKKEEVTPPKIDITNEDCKGADKCEDNADVNIARVRDGDEIIFGSMIDLKERVEVNFQEVQINFGIPQFGM